MNSTITEIKITLEKNNSKITEAEKNRKVDWVIELWKRLKQNKIKKIESKLGHSQKLL